VRSRVWSNDNARPLNQALLNPSEISSGSSMESVHGEREAECGSTIGDCGTPKCERRACLFHGGSFISIRRVIWAHLPGGPTREPYEPSERDGFPR
jgi:hypothetical protein